MIARVYAWLTEQLDESEKDKRCLVATTRKEKARMKQALAEGLVVHVMPHIYARPKYWDELSAGEKMLHKMRSMQLLDPNVVFTGASAACARGLSVSNRYLVRPCVVTNRQAHRKGDDYIDCTVVTGDEITREGNLSLTSRGRMVADCLRAMTFRDGLALVDSSLRTWSMSCAQMAKEVEQCYHRSAGIHRMRALIDLGDGRAESGGESFARATMLELGMALPDLQREFPNPSDPTQPYRVDYAWDVAGGCILGELDGLEKYRNPEMTGGKSLAKLLEEEHRRQSHIEANDKVLRVVRFGFSDVLRDESFLRLLVGCGVPRTFAFDERVVRAGGVLRCR